MAQEKQLRRDESVEVPPWYVSGRTLREAVEHLARALPQDEEGQPIEDGEMYEVTAIHIRRVK